MKKIWDYLAGNKTIICLFIVSVLSQPYIQGLINNAKLVEFLIWAFGALAAGSFVDHVRKGYFSSGKGQ